MHSTHELTMYITTYSDGASYRLNVRLLHQDFSSLKSATTSSDQEILLKDQLVGHGVWTDLVAKSFYIGLRQLLALAKLLNPAVYFMFHGDYGVVVEREDVESGYGTFVQEVRGF